MVDAVSSVSGGNVRGNSAVGNVAGPQRRADNSALRSIERRVAEIQRELGGRENQPTSQAQPVKRPPVNRGISFELKPEINMIQTLVFDRKAGEVIREIPTSDRLQFVEQFRKQLENNIGRRFDMEV